MGNAPNSDRRAFLRTALAGVAGLSMTGSSVLAAVTQAGSPITALPLSGDLTLVSGAGANVVAHSSSDGTTPLMASAGMGHGDNPTRGRFNTEVDGLTAARVLVEGGAAQPDPEMVALLEELARAN